VTEALVDLVRWAVDIVERDVRTSGFRPTLAVEEDERGVFVWFDGGTYGNVFQRLDDRTEVLAEVAQVIQVDICDQVTTWPTCAEHDRGLHAEVVDGEAVWSCHAGPHVVARIGELR
jgi:hypothetical protein